MYRKLLYLEFTVLEGLPLFQAISFYILLRLRTFVIPKEPKFEVLKPLNTDLTQRP